jgi:hypothetical protein
MVLFSLVLIVGCTPDESVVTTHETLDSMMFTTKVTSEPSGARVELNGEIIGVTPLEIEWKVYSANQNLLFSEDHVLRALPTGLGRYVQKKTFSKGTAAPRIISFEMKE